MWVKWLLPFVLVGSAGAIAIWHVSAARGDPANAQAGLRGNPADPASILADRSPGDRDPGALFQTKPVANMAIPEEPNAPQANLLEPSPLPAIEDVPRAFSAIAPPPPDEIPQVAGAVPVAQPVSIPVGSASSASPIVPFQQVPLPFFGPPVIQQVGPAPPGTDVPIGSIPAAPEPASWMTMLIGFFGLGSMLRRYRRKRHSDIPA